MHNGVRANLQWDSGVFFQACAGLSPDERWRITVPQSTHTPLLYFQLALIYGHRTLKTFVCNGDQGCYGRSGWPIMSFYIWRNRLDGMSTTQIENNWWTNNYIIFSNDCRTFRDMNITELNYYIDLCPVTKYWIYHILCIGCFQRNMKYDCKWFVRKVCGK